MLSMLNMAYKVLVVYTGIQLQFSFSQREAIIAQMQIDAGLPSTRPATTSSGEPLDARSLAAGSRRARCTLPASKSR